MKVLVTGGAGFIGSILCKALLQRGYEVACLDKLYFGDKGIRDLIGERGFQLIKEDTRRFDPSMLDSIDIVIDLAAIGQPDPAGKLKPDLFSEMNYKGPVRVANLSKKHGVKRYLFASTCSVYGAQPHLVNESSPLNPLEEYARTKAMVEREIRPLSSENFCVTIFRFATAYGLSLKMRFDLVVNGMTLSLYKTGVIKVMRPGTQVRPMVHVADIAKAIISAIEADEDDVNGEIYNVGSNDQNYQIYDLAKLIGDSVNKPCTIEWYGEPDTRSYEVDFTKINKRLGFTASYTPIDGAREIYKALEDGVIADTPETRVIEWWRQLQDKGGIKWRRMKSTRR